MLQHRPHRTSLALYRTSLVVSRTLLTGTAFQRVSHMRAQPSNDQAKKAVLGYAMPGLYLYQYHSMLWSGFFDCMYLTVLLLNVPLRISADSRSSVNMQRRCNAKDYRGHGTCWIPTRRETVRMNATSVVVPGYDRRRR